MKWIIVLTLVFVASHVSAEKIADGEGMSSFDEDSVASETEVQTTEVDGKIDAALTVMCLNDYPSFRKIILAENQTDIETMEKLQIKFDQRGDSKWFSGISQLLTSAENLQIELRAPLSEVTAERCDEIMNRRSGIYSTIMRAPRYR